MSRPAAGTPPCPCGLPRAYADCCGRYHAGAEYLGAPTAEALMRSRYSAYVLKLETYLLATWHPSTRPAALELEGDEAKWLGLDVKRVVSPEKGLPFSHPEKGAPFGHPTGTPFGRNLQKNADAAASDLVEFVARYKIGGRAHRLHETSRFAHEDGRWFYVDGEIKPR